MSRSMLRELEKKQSEQVCYLRVENWSKVFVFAQTSAYEL